MRQCKHPGIIELYSVAETPNMIFLITELCEGGSLAGLLSQSEDYTTDNLGGLEECVVVTLMRQICSAISYLHNRGIIHRDLKLQNILLVNKVEIIRRRFSDKKKETLDKCGHDVYNESIKKSRILRSSSKSKVRRTILKGTDNPERSANFDLGLAQDTSKSRINDPSTCTIPPNLHTKLIDFGMSIELRKNEEAVADCCGTPFYMAPEVLNGKSYTRQCDIWSLGVIMYQLLSNKFPFESRNDKKLVEEITNYKLGERQSDYSNNFSGMAFACLSHMLNLDPIYRYSASELLLDSWFTMRSDDHTNCIVPAMDFEYVPQIANIGGSKKLIELGPATKSQNDPSLSGHRTNVMLLMKEFHRELYPTDASPLEKNKK